MVHGSFDTKCEGNYITNRTMNRQNAWIIQSNKNAKEIDAIKPQFIKYLLQGHQP